MTRTPKDKDPTILATLIAALLNSSAPALAADEQPTTRKERKKGMRDLNYELKKISERNCDGSEAAQDNRERIVSLMANHLDKLGFHKLHATGLKQKHVDALVAHWKAEDLAPGTIKNRMCALRWWAEKIGKPNLIARSNTAYGIQDRQYVTNISKGKDVVPEQLARVADPRVAMSLRLQAMFGLRREESMKIRPVWADRNDHITLKASWCKGGRARDIPIRTAEQRALLNEARALAGKGSLIPVELQYKDQLQRYKYQCRKAGIDNAHGHRHYYAQQRYLELTGWACPANGGPTSKQLTAEQKAIDREARLIISRELGHEREQITAVYLGR